MSRAHQEVVLPMLLAEGSSSPTAGWDLATRDLAANDQALAEDLAAADLAAQPDLLPPPDLAPVNPLVQLGAVATGTSTLTMSLPAASRAGTLLVLTMTFDKNADPAVPVGWVRWSAYNTTNNAELFYLVDNPGAITQRW